MAVLSSKLVFKSLLFFRFLSVLAQEHSLLSCENKSVDALGYRCNSGSDSQCDTFVILHINSYYSSLGNLSSYLGLDEKAVAEANGFSLNTEKLPLGQPLLIPIVCTCDGGFFHADVMKVSMEGESFYGIAEALEGLTTCSAILEKNPSISPLGLKDKVRLMIPLRCSCPSPFEFNQGTELLLSYPISEGDMVSNLASKFHTSREAIIYSNNKSGTFKQEKLEPFSTLLIPLEKQPNPFFNPPEHHKKRSKAWKIGVYIAIIGISTVCCVSLVTLILFIHWRRKKRLDFYKKGDVELQKLSIRTKSEIKTVSEDSLDHFDCLTINNTTPHKMVVETYSLEDLKKATEDFNLSNHIEGSMFHGLLNGKNLAIKCTKIETISKIDLDLFHDFYHHHPSIIRFLGTCLNDVPDSYLVFEYAKNGSLKDWIHGGLAMKSHFIASCDCFLNWNQRLRICLDVAMGIQYMHQIMNPSHTHRNIKSKNILLDEEFNAKIGDFGMARCIEDDHNDTNSGYLAPEYLQGGKISSSIDIFAYGVVLLEMLSGKTPKGEGSHFLLSQEIKSILQSEDEEGLRGWMDHALGDTYSFDMAVKLAHIAKACVEDDPASRPSAGDIVEKLSKLVGELAEEEQALNNESLSKPLVELHS
ncbi:hypothetical protein GIB67_002821 [Kingdonia uniflora]|uniref:Protein kinase domain-containing protein n=1 Tax=Kingdonia uniflora TaxID=39325 RepID=A0A7J7M569_9MAGN|nr:hypothetical protein GIB67_002821 [Kingdonia uniflora]